MRGWYEARVLPRVSKGSTVDEVVLEEPLGEAGAMTGVKRRMLAVAWRWENGFDIVGGWLCGLL